MELLLKSCSLITVKILLDKKDYIFYAGVLFLLRALKIKIVTSLFINVIYVFEHVYNNLAKTKSQTLIISEKTL